MKELKNVHSFLLLLLPILKKEILPMTLLLAKVLPLIGGNNTSGAGGDGIASLYKLW